MSGFTGSGGAPAVAALPGLFNVPINVGKVTTLSVTLPGTIAAGGTYTSGLLGGSGGNHVAVSAQMDQAGTLGVQHYLDAAGSVADGSLATAAMTANTLATVDNVGSISPGASFKISIVNGNGSVAATVDGTKTAVTVSDSTQPTGQVTLPATIPASGTWTSGALPTYGMDHVAASAQIDQAGTLSVQRYLDAGGTLAQGSPTTAAMSANTLAIVDNLGTVVAQSFKVSVINGAASQAKVDTTKTVVTVKR